MLNAIRKRGAVAYDKGRAPGVRAQNVCEPSLRVGVVALGLREVIRFAGHHRQARAVRRGIARAPFVAESPGVQAGLFDSVRHLLQELLAYARLRDGQATRISSHLQSAV